MANGIKIITMKRTSIILVVLSIYLCVFYACKEEDITPDIEGIDGWYALTSGFSSNTLYSVYFVNENLGFTVGNDIDSKINILKTKNGGKN